MASRCRHHNSLCARTLKSNDAVWLWVAEMRRIEMIHL